MRVTQKAFAAKLKAPENYVEKNRIFLLIYIVSWPFVRSQKGHPRLRLGPKIVIRLNSSVGLLRNTRGAMAKAGGPRIWVEKVSANL